MADGLGKEGWADAEYCEMHLSAKLRAMSKLDEVMASVRKPRYVLIHRNIIKDMPSGTKGFETLKFNTENICSSPQPCSLS